MFKRIITSLFSPKETAEYAHDSWWKPALIFLFILVLIVLSFLLPSFFQNGLPYETEKAIRLAFNDQNVQYSIENGELVSQTNETYEISLSDNIAIVISEKEEIKSDKELIILLTKQDVYLQISQIKEILLQYNDYESIKNIDLSRASNPNDIEFWNIIFSIVNKKIQEYKPITLVVDTFGYLFYWGFVFLILTLILAGLSAIRYGRNIPFRYLWRVSLYNSFIFALALIFTNLFNIRFFIYIGGLLMAVYHIASAKQLLLQEIINRRN